MENTTVLLLVSELGTVKSSAVGLNFGHLIKRRYSIFTWIKVNDMLSRAELILMFSIPYPVPRNKIVQGILNTWIRLQQFILFSKSVLKLGIAEFKHVRCTFLYTLVNPYVQYVPEFNMAAVASIPA